MKNNLKWKETALSTLDLNDNKINCPWSNKITCETSDLPRSSWVIIFKLSSSLAHQIISRSIILLFFHLLIYLPAVNRQRFEPLEFSARQFYVIKFSNVNYGSVPQSIRSNLFLKVPLRTFRIGNHVRPTRHGI